MEHVQPSQILIPIGIALFIGVMLLVWGDRPELYAAIRRRLFADRRRAIMSSDDEDDDPEPVRTGSSAGSAIPVRSQQNQPEPIELAQNEPVIEPAQLYRLSKEDEIVVLALQRDDTTGKYRHSANEITKFIGGTAADVKRIIAAVRAETDELPAKTQPRSIYRPRSGWQA